MQEEDSMFKNEEALPDIRDDPNHPEAQAHQHDPNLNQAQQQQIPLESQQAPELNQASDLPPPPPPADSEPIHQQPQGETQLPADPHEHAPGMTHEVHDQLGQDYCLANGDCTRDDQPPPDAQEQIPVSF